MTWYAQNKRDLLWRKTQDPYKILVSEVMLQQTQVSRVIPKYDAWLEKRSTVFALAQASREQVLQMWSWLGFNRRGINLHEACKKIAYDALSGSWMCAESENQLWVEKKIKNAFKTPQNPSKTIGFPQTSDKMLDKCGKVVFKIMQDYAYLRTLPWVGEYTANAILAFAYNFEVPVIDINIKRVLLHSFDLSIDMPLFELQSLALSLVPFWRSRDWHNALMDYGSMVLHSKATGIQSPKQSQFKWSDREVRGWILKQLVGNTTTPVKKWVIQKKSFQEKTRKNARKSLPFSDIQAHFPIKDIQGIVAGMEKEGIVKVKGNGVVL